VVIWYISLRFSKKNLATLLSNCNFNTNPVVVSKLERFSSQEKNIFSQENTPKKV
jgi:hypothetical protein